VKVEPAERGAHAPLTCPETGENNFRANQGQHVAMGFSITTTAHCEHDAPATWPTDLLKRFPPPG